MMPTMPTSVAHPPLVGTSPQTPAWMPTPICLTKSWDSARLLPETSLGPPRQMPTLPQWMMPSCSRQW